MVCHGRRVEKEEIVKAELVGLACFHDVTVRVEELALTDEYPKDFPIPDKKLVDELGQNRLKQWVGKLNGAGELKSRLNSQLSQKDKGYPFEEWSAYGGWKRKKLQEGTGFFPAARKREGGGWWIPKDTPLASQCRLELQLFRF